MARIVIEDAQYGPNPFYLRQGGTMFYRFNVGQVPSEEDDPENPVPPPDQYDYTIRIKAEDGSVVKTLTGSVPSEGQSSVPVVVEFPPTKDAGGAFDFGNYANEFQAGAAGRTGSTQTVCSGRPVRPEPCKCDPSCPV